MKTSAQRFWETRGVVTVQRPEPPRSTAIESRPGLYLQPPGEALLTAQLLLEIRRKIVEEVRQLRAYAADAPEHQGELRRVLEATADRLEGIVGGAPV